MIDSSDLLCHADEEEKKKIVDLLVKRVQNLKAINWEQCASHTIYIAVEHNATLHACGCVGVLFIVGIVIEPALDVTARKWTTIRTKCSWWWNFYWRIMFTHIHAPIEIKPIQVTAKIDRAECTYDGNAKFDAITMKNWNKRPKICNWQYKHNVN